MSFAILLRWALHARWGLVALAALLLVAQHGALTHAFVHAGLHEHDEAVHAHAHAAGHDEAHPEHMPAGDLFEFCAFDLLYSQVLGAVHAGHAPAFAAAGHVLAVSAILAVRNSVTVVPYDSRGPPALS